MIKARLVKADNWSHCIGCAKPIKDGSTMVEILFCRAGSTTVIDHYCEKCTDKIYKGLKPVLDRKLWIFK